MRKVPPTTELYGTVTRWKEILLLAFLTTALQARGEADERWFEAIGERAWLANYDPTLIGRRVLTEMSYEDDKDSDTTKLSTSARYSALIQPNIAAGLQISQSLEWKSIRGDTTGGLGDLEVRGGLVGRLTDSFRWGAGTNLKFATATSPILSDPFEIEALGALSWDLTKRLNLILQPSYSITPGTTGKNATNKITLKLPISFRIVRWLSASVSYKTEWEFTSHQAIHKLEGGLTVLPGSHDQFAISPAIEIPLSQQDLNWKAMLTAGWYF